MWEKVMRQRGITTLISLILPASSLALAQTTAPSPAPDAGAAAGGLADWWWVILLILIVAAAIWYFAMYRRRPPGSRGGF
jgi:type II secretory pathway component PulF